LREIDFLSKIGDRFLACFTPSGCTQTHLRCGYATLGLKAHNV